MSGGVSGGRAATTRWILAVSLLLASVTAAHSATHALPEALVRALDRDDPLALADSVVPRLATLDEGQRDSVAARLRHLPIARRVACWAFLQTGTRYQLGSLGEEQPPDSDPLLRFDVTDCAVLNLTSVALAHREDAGDERRAMVIAQYREGRIAFDARFHFTTDRLDGSPYYRDVTRALGGRRCRSARVHLNRRADGSRWIDIPWSRHRVVTYLPRAQASQLPRWRAAGRIPEALGVAFVRARTFEDGLDVVHESMLWNGRLILHASSTTGRVVLLPFADYLAGPGRGFDGLVLFEYR